MMTCRQVREYLPEYAAGRAAECERVAEHLSRCEACSAAVRELQAVFAAMAAAPEPPVSASGEARARIALQEAAASTHAASPGGAARSRFPWPIRVGVGALLALALLALQPRHGSKSAGAEVEAAVQRANTWHLSGWKILGGRRIPWEIWGRRSPFFYREQSGDELNFDDGTQRVRMVSTWPHGELVAVRVASGPAPSDQWRSLFTMGTGWRQMKPWRETRDAVIFHSGYDDGKPKPYRPMGDYYTVDKRTWLPLRKEYLADTSNPPRLVSILSAEYDIPVPAAVTALDLPRGIRLFDTLAQAAPGTLPTENSVQARGLTLQATPLAVDSDGTVLIRYRAWLGGVKLDSWETPLFYTVDCDHMRFGVWGSDKTAYHSNDGRPYIELRTALWPGLPSGEQLKVYAPLEPRAPGAPLLRTLILELEVAPSVRARNSQYTAFFRQPLTVAVPLPAQPSPAGIESQLPTGKALPHGLPLAAAIARARAQQFYSQKNPAQAIYWMTSSLHRADPFTDVAQEIRLELALLYNDAGDRRRAEQLYRDVIQIGHHHPETHQRFTQEARVSLHTAVSHRRYRPRF